jgi:hypothetical protein
MIINFEFHKIRGLSTSQKLLGPSTQVVKRGEAGSWLQFD